MPTLEVSNETFEKIKDQLQADEVKSIAKYEDMVGRKYFFRTVTFHLVGEVKAVFGKFLELKDASWVADSGRFMGAIKDGALNEVEPVGVAWVNLDSVTDFFPWKHKLPKDQK